MANQLRAHLQICFPGAVGLFADIDSEISLRFLERFPTQDTRRLALAQAAGRPGWPRSATAAAPRPTPCTPACAPRPDGATGPAGDTAATVTAAFVAVLRTITAQIEALAAQIAEQLELHPDTPIFTSLPRSGSVRAARLLAEIGDARGRFPTADSLACLAGVAPSTRQSGKIEAVTFRWGADKQLRDALCDFAGDSRHANPWAADLYHRARARGHDHPHAVRILARAWVDIIWACWTTHTALRPRPHTAPSNASSTKINRRRLDTGQLTTPQGSLLLRTSQRPPPARAGPRRRPRRSAAPPGTRCARARTRPAGRRGGGSPRPGS